MKSHYLLILYLICANSLSGIETKSEEKEVEVLFKGSIIYPEELLLPFSILKKEEGGQCFFSLYFPQARYSVPLTRHERFKGESLIESFHCAGGSLSFYHDQDGDCVNPEFFDKNAQTTRSIAEAD